MECSYVKYNIIEFVPVEIKSRRTPLFTIVNSILLWSWLLCFFIYMNIVALFDKRKSIKLLYKNKYTTKKPANDSPVSMRRKALAEEGIDRRVWREEFEIVEIKSQIFKRKQAKTILKELLENEEYGAISDFDPELIQDIGAFTLRKDVITIETDTPELIQDKIIITRSISKPVQMFLDFALYKIW